MATTYKILDPLAGVPTVVEGKEGDVELIGTDIVDSRDPIEKAMSIHDPRDAQQRATQLSFNLVLRKRMVFDKFAKHDELNSNRLNRWLNHTRESSSFSLMHFYF